MAVPGPKVPSGRDVGPQRPLAGEERAERTIQIADRGGEHPSQPGTGTPCGHSAQLSASTCWNRAELAASEPLPSVPHRTRSWPCTPMLRWASKPTASTRRSTQAGASWRKAGPTRSRTNARSKSCRTGRIFSRGQQAPATCTYASRRPGTAGGASVLPEVPGPVVAHSPRSTGTQCHGRGRDGLRVSRLGRPESVAHRGNPGAGPGARVTAFARGVERTPWPGWPAGGRTGPWHSWHDPLSRTRVPRATIGRHAASTLAQAAAGMEPDPSGETGRGAGRVRVPAESPGPLPGRRSRPRRKVRPGSWLRWSAGGQGKWVAQSAWSPLVGRMCRLEVA
jgi:hypothetical protein